MNADRKERLDTIAEKLDDDNSEVTTEECLLYLSEFTGTPLEVLELRFALLTGEEVLECPEFL